MARISRRDFIQKSSQALAAGFIIGSTSESFPGTDSTAVKNKVTLQYRNLGKTGLKVTEVAYGAMRTTDAAVLEYALDLGINLVDTAHVYQGGNNEIMVGKVVSKRRKDVVLCTKIVPESRSNMIQAFEKSLKRLNTDYVDVLYFHSMKEIEDIHHPEALDLFTNWKKEGKARFIGFSTHSNEAELLDQAARDKFWEVILVAYNFKKESKLTEAIHKASAAGIGIVAMKTQAGGYQTDTMGNLSPHQASLKWVLQNPDVHTSIPSMATFSELEENIQVMGKKMGWLDRKTLDRYGRSIEGQFCKGCNACQNTCPHGVDIPEVNRCIMYIEGYRDVQLGKFNYQQLPQDKNAKPCTQCSSCTAQCSNGIDLRKRMPAAHGLFA